MNGLVLIDKPGGMTSHDVVNRWRRLASTKRVGHLGTLDPMATGLLALVTGTATRLAPFFSMHTKTYLAEIRFGAVSDTYDAEGEVQTTGVAVPGADAIQEQLMTFVGRTSQMPPAISAKKIKGVPAYKLARQNKPVVLQPVEVEMSRIEIVEQTENVLKIMVTCSAGTYIRSLAHDLGQRLGCGAILSGLRRTHSGELDVQQARTLEQLQQLAEQGRVSEAVIPSGQLLPAIPSEHFDSLAELHIRQGRTFRTSPFVVPPGSLQVKALSRSGELIAVGELKFPNFYHPKTVL